MPVLKLVVTILSFVYLASTVGATVHLHYCMDKLVETGLWKDNDKKCGKCGMEKSPNGDNGCCKDEQKQYKLESDHKAATAYQLSHVLVAAVPVSFIELPQIKLATITEQHPLSHAPPRSGDIAVHIRNCVFRI